MLKTIPVDFVGGYKRSRSRAWSSQSSVNMYASVQSSGRTSEMLMPWPGEKLFSTGSGVCRGLINHNETLYGVFGSTLYEISEIGVRTSVGTGIYGSGRCVMVSTGDSIVIRAGATYIYNGSVLSVVNDPDLEHAATLAYINQQVVYQGTSNKIFISNAGDYGSVSALNVGSAESIGDDLRQVYSFNERLYLAGSKSVEVWYNSGVGNPPFTKIDQGTASIGAASPYVLSSNDSYLYMLASDDNVYRTNAYQWQPIADESICKELRESSTVNAVGYCVNLDGYRFYIIQLPSSNKTLAYCQETGEWIRLSTGVSPDFFRHMIETYAYCYGRHLIGSNADSNIYEWDFNTFNSNGDTIIRQRDSAPINGIQLGIPGTRLFMNKAEFFMETGEATATNPNPEIMVSASYDNGRSFTSEDWIKTGRDGETIRRVEWYNCATFYDIVLRVRISDQFFTGIHGASIKVKPAGW